MTGTTHSPVAVQVRRFTAHGLLRERAIVYSDDVGHRVLKQHSYHFWMDAPARLLHDYWTARLQDANTRAVGELIAPAFALHGRLRRMERLLNERGVEIAVSIELSLRDNATGVEVLQRRYDVTKSASSDRVLDSVKAFESALHSIHSQFVVELAALSSQADRRDRQPTQVSLDYPGR